MTTSCVDVDPGGDGEGDGDTVLVTTRSFGSGLHDLAAELAESGLRVVRGDHRHDPDRLGPELARARAWIAGTAPVTSALLDAAPRLAVLARYGVGVDAVDLEAAARRHVTVTNTPGANSDAVAEHTLALLLAVLRHVVVGVHDVRDGHWVVHRGRELGGLRVGVLGAGRVGRGVVRRLVALGCDVVCADPFLPADAAEGLGVPLVEQEELVRRSEVVTLHAPGGSVLLDESWVALAPAEQVVVNTARADLVDEALLARALREHRLAGYAADTLAGETGNGSPLLAEDLADRVLVTPHVAAQTVQSVDRMGAMAVANVLAVLAGNEPPNPVTAEDR